MKNNTTLFLILLFFVPFCLLIPAQSDEAKPPVSVFSELDGKWKGNFIGYNSKGEILYKIEVMQIYKTVSDTTQEVDIEDKSEDGEVITGKGKNIATLNPDGSYSLKCIVEKSNGDKVEHIGTLSKGPDGEKNIIWYSNKPDRVETFRESVEKRYDGEYYLIQGMGIYGNTPILMSGSYKRVE